MGLANRRTSQLSSVASIDSTAEWQNLELDDVPTVGLSISRPSDYLDLYLHDLGFNLRLLLHEVALIEMIFYDSSETQSQLVSQLKSLFVDVAHREFEKFFDQKLDLSRLNALENDLIIQVVLMLTRINRIKERLGTSQFDDMESNVHMLKFVMRTNEICAPVFQNLLDAIQKSTNIELAGVTPDFGLHPFIVKICSIWRLICLNESAVANAVRISLTITNDTVSIFNLKEKSRSITSINRLNTDEGSQHQPNQFAKFMAKKMNNLR